MVQHGYNYSKNVPTTDDYFIILVDKHSTYLVVARWKIKSKNDTHTFYLSNICTNFRVHRPLGEWYNRNSSSGII